MTQQFPFTDPNPGWGPGKKLKSADMATVSANAAQAADGLVWSDLAIVKNFATKSTIGTVGGRAVCWDAFLSRWVVCGTPSANTPSAVVSTDGRDDWIALTVPAGTNWGSTARVASNGVGSLVMTGGGGSATASKVRQSADGGVTWTARNTVASSNETAKALVWHPGASLFVIGLDSAVNTNIETSPDGITWTQRTGLPNALARRSAVATNGARVVMLSASNKYVYSTDCVTWTEGTLPASVVWQCVAWNDRSGKFMVLSLTNDIATSADGITWTTVGLTNPFNGSTPSICAYGRMWIAVGQTALSSMIYASIDDGVSWDPVKTLISSTGNYSLATGDNQVICADGPTGNVYASLRGGL